MKATNTIHLNGKVYDAKTGMLLSEAKKIVEKATAVANTPVTLPKRATAKHRRGNGYIDGISRNPHATHKTVPHKQTVASTSQSHAPKPKSSSRKSPHSVHQINSIKRHISHSATLHRSSKKAPVLKSDTPSKLVSKKISHTPAPRMQRAHEIHRSSLISKFGPAQQAPKKPSAMAEAPEANLSLSHIASVAEQAKRTQGSNAIKHSLIAQSLEKAQQQSEQPSPKKPHKSKRSRSKGAKKIQFASLSVAVLVLAAYVTYLNVPALSMKVASSRAGFAATLPGQTPAGYRLQGPIAYSPGQVVINFGSNTDDRHFTIQQQPTTWDSDALKENYVAKNSTGEPNTYQDSGLTVYMFGAGDAAWVNDGKFYSIKSDNSQLDSRQILAIATSM